MDREEILRNLGARVRDIRKGKGVSQLQLAHLLGKDQQSIQRLESGRINPSFYYLYEISRGLNVEIRELLGD